jgi:hypothetical protein
MMRSFIKLINFLTLPILSLCLLSCIYVEDIGYYWDKGIIDQAIAGSWKSSDSDDCSSFIVSGDSYQVIEKGKKENSLYRTLLLGDNKFLMVKDAKGKYLLIKYQISDNNFTTYTPDEAKKEGFLRDYPDSNIIISDEKFSTATIKHLDEKTAELLQKIAGDETYWKVASTQHRAENCKESDAKH